MNSATLQILHFYILTEICMHASPAVSCLVIVGTSSHLGQSFRCLCDAFALVVSLGTSLASSEDVHEHTTSHRLGFANTGAAAGAPHGGHSGEGL